MPGDPEVPVEEGRYVQTHRVHGGVVSPGVTEDRPHRGGPGRRTEEGSCWGETFVERVPEQCSREGHSSLGTVGSTSSDAGT